MTDASDPLDDPGSPLPGEAESAALDPRVPGTEPSLRVTILIVFGFVLAASGLAFLVAQALGLLLIGPLQLLWAVPTAIYAKVQTRPRLFKVSLIVAGTVFLLNVTCTAIVFSTIQFGG